MKRYTPSLERVWAEWHRRERTRKMQADRVARGLPARSPTPPNSTPWLPHPPRNLDDLWFISESIKKYIIEWYGPSHPSLRP